MSEKQFDPHYWPINLALSNNFFEVPVYQRPYSWSSKEVNSLLKDIFCGYNKRKTYPDDELFTGTLFLRFKGKGADGVKDRYEIVDGQQRLATISMMLLSVYSIARIRGFDESVPDIVTIRSFLWKYSNQQYNKNERLLTLNSIDSDIFRFIFDSTFDDPSGIKNSLKGYNERGKTEENIKKMFNSIYDFIFEKTNQPGMDKNEIITFFNFIINKVIFIAIQSSVSMPRVFSVFESINSKGKPLDRIDLIKTTIFSIIDEKDYNTYLTKWGQLIIKTGDNLEDYFQTFVRSYFLYYRQAIGIAEFKYMSRQLPHIYNKENEAEGLKAFIDDMLEQVDSYAYLSDENLADNFIDKPSFKTFYRLFTINHYRHPNALFFRSFYEYKNGKISKEDVTKIVKSATLYMFKFQSINGGDSKDAISTFEKICKYFYNKQNLDADYIERAFKDALKLSGVDAEMIKSKLLAINAYSKRELAYSILALVESIDEKTKRLSFSQASLILSHIKDDTFQLDHMMPQSPAKDDAYLKYYKLKFETGNETLVLKDGHDFQDDVFDGMNYDEFMARTINRIGNIRFLLPDQNKFKDHDVLILPTNEPFVKYEQVMDRCSEIAQKLINTPDLM